MTLARARAYVPLGGGPGESRQSDGGRPLAIPNSAWTRRSATGNIQRVPTEALPRFRYHPDPMPTGSLVESSAVCKVCGRSRGVIYKGPFYAVDEVDFICPWCIADGSAAARFDGEFSDLSYFGWESVSTETKREVLQRTPGFSGWQREMWFAHCDDAAAFIGRVGSPRLRQLGPDAVEAIKSTMRGPGWDEAALDGYVDALDADGEPTAYLFRCIRCGAYVGYSDSG